MPWPMADLCNKAAAIESIVPKLGCVPQTLNEWFKRFEVDVGMRECVTTNEVQLNGSRQTAAVA